MSRGRIAPVNIRFRREGDYDRASGFFDGYDGDRIARLSSGEEFWRGAGNYGAIAKRIGQSRRGHTNDCRWELTELCEKARGEAYELLLEHAGQHGANAILAMRYDANEVMQGVTEVLAYGTAVQVEKIS
jgi:uncharacterized protein YbjQ (UPF0145 family)